MLPDRVSNPGPLTYESGALPIALRGPANGFIYPAAKETRKLVTFKLIENKICQFNYGIQLVLHVTYIS